MDSEKIKAIQIVVRIILGLFLTILIWYRVDWTVGLLAFLLLMRAEIQDFKQ